MNAKSAYQEYYEQVTKEAEKVPNALEISQTALWFKAIAIRALESKKPEFNIVSTPENKCLFTEAMLNQVIQFTINQMHKNSSKEEHDKAQWLQGYEAAREEFAKATGLFTVQTSNDGGY